LNSTLAFIDCFLSSLRLFLSQAKEAHNKHKVFPVPVGLSSAARKPPLSA